MERTVMRMLDEAVRDFPDDAYTLRKTDSGWEATTYAQTRAKARAFAAWLMARGFAREDAAAILAEGCPEWVVGELGLLMAGCVSVPLSIKLLGEEIPFRLQHSGSRALLVTHNQLEKVLAALASMARKDIILVQIDDAFHGGTDHAKELAAKVGVEPARILGLSAALEEGGRLLETPEAAAALEARMAEIREDGTVTICYTSGTTGNPKGIMLTHLNYWSNCHDSALHFGLPRGWRTLLVLPVDHSFAHTCGLYYSLVASFSLWFVDSRGGGIATLRNIPVNLLEARPHLLMTVPALSGNFMKKIVAGIEEKGGLIERIFKRGIEAGIAFNGNGFNKPRLGVRLANFLPWTLAKLLVFGAVKKKVFGPSIRFCVGGGALLDVKQQEFFAALGIPIYQGYGLTEAAPVISSNCPKRHKFGSSGPVLSTVKCTLRRPNGSLVGPGETGEIVIRGENVMKGYFHNPEATAAALRDGWLWTGDLARWDEDGFLVVVGREKALLIHEDGEKYSPEEIEEAITFSTDVIDQIMVWCDHRKYASAFVTLDEAKVRRLVEARGIMDAQGLLVALKDEFYRFKADPKGRKVQATWIPAAFHIMPEPWSDRDGTMNSTMKIVRHRIAEVHRDRIDFAYTQAGSGTENARNLETLRKLLGLP
jgi:long-chain acyl-CoA synthetase